MNNFRYTFHIDGDVYDDLDYKQYLGNQKLRDAVMDRGRRRLFLGLTVYSYSYDYLIAHKDKRDELDHLTLDWKLNKLKYFCPNSQDQLDFINDWGKHDVMAIVAPNRIGKTSSAVVKALLSPGVLKLDPEWPIFTKHGIVYREFTQQNSSIKFGFGSYEWSHVKATLWPRVREYIPDEQLGVYSTQLQKKRGRPRKDPNFERMPMVELSNGISDVCLKFHAYSQSQANYESDAYDGFLYDEQPPECIFDAVDERTRTVRGIHIFSMTPHKVQGMPHTGGGGWLQRFLTGEETKGHSIATYNTSLADVPDWIYPETEKHKAFEKWIHEPTKLRNIKVLREGRSRVLGEWHKTSGLVIDEWDRRIHVVDPFEVPDNWTRYRGLDHGITNPTACLWAAVSPPQGEWGSDVVIYREYYSQGKTVSENVAEVLKLSGNARRDIGSVSNAKSGMTMAMFEEVQSKEYYAKTVLDSRSFALNDPGSGKNYGWIYKTSGLPCAPASGKNSSHWVPMLKELFTPVYDKDHKYNKDKEGKPEKGRAHIMIFSSCVNLIREIEGWVWEEYRSGGDAKNLKETPRKKDDHGCTALGYLCQIPLRFRGDLYRPASGSDNEWAGDRRYGSDESDNGEYRGV